MKQPENKTILNDTISLLNSKMGPIAVKSQLTSTVLSGIQKGRQNFKPYIPKKMCQFPNPPRMDDFNMGEGLGVMSLQPAIDGLNQFKESVINEVKTKFQAMGPENAKDTKLAAGAVDLIKKVYDAAKCFTQVVTAVNKLVNTYIQVINFIIVDVINKINILEAQINQLRGMLCLQVNLAFLIQICGQALVSKLLGATGMFDLLGAVVELQNAIAEAEMAATTLLDSDKRIKKQLSIGLTLLQNRINSFLYYQSLHGCLETNKASAVDSFMVDDFLDNFNLDDIQEASFNWSVTNSGAIFDCNIDDELHIIPKMNDMVKNFNPATATFVTIAGRNEEGWIVVPDTYEGLISAGLDPILGRDTNLIFDLSINNGETIIRSVATGKRLGPNDSVTTRTIGSYFNYGKETFDYHKVISILEDNTFDLYLIDQTKKSDIVIGSLYKFINPLTLKPWMFSWDYDNGIDPVVPNYFPLLFKVIDVTSRYVKVKVLGETDLDITKYIPGANPTSYIFTTDFAAPPGDINGNIKFDTTDIDGMPGPTFGDILVDAIFTWPSVTIGLITIPAQTVADGLHYRYDVADPIIKTYIEMNSLTLSKYNLVTLVDKIPHAGERIRCHNWTLSVRVMGNISKINGILFGTSYPGENISLFFLKAKWGFIPVRS